MSLTVTATELHDRTAELTERAMRQPDRPIVVERRGKPAVMLVDARYFEGLLETLDLMSDPEAMAAIRRGLADIEAGRVTSHEDVLKEFGLDGRSNRHHRVGLVGIRKEGHKADVYQMAQRLRRQGKI
jgi:antitoxin YefM